jgi:hypothetical protein
LYDEKNLYDRLGRLSLRCSGCRAIVAGATNLGATGSAECARTGATTTDVHSAGGAAWRVGESGQHHGHWLHFTQSPELGGSDIDARSCWDSRFEQSVRWWFHVERRQTKRRRGGAERVSGSGRVFRGLEL